MVRGGISGRIGFGFDDAAGESAGGKLPDDHFADQETSERNRAGGKLGAAKAPNGHSLAVINCGSKYLSNSAPRAHRVWIPR
jgi:hypothetical protein